ncbi:hypothetical protein [Calothrix sp. PCC 6303]|uniref:hypothetical protein n=1 Tax=Calothrix sp. PCC 6303 TaxID=1170562 RepID=UPI0002A03388|nr:hypothetical protein [Calothrix sp. PCC 6303]AFZ01538.1 hypothetical protein Cal6303_2556 [Calothrix sp. PCC 6303]
MYVKFAAAIICITLCSLNVVAAVKRTPIRTTLEGSTRTTVEMMPSPNSSVHWLSATIFIAGFASFLGWGISEYNNGIEGDEIIDTSAVPEQRHQTNTVIPNNVELSPPINPAGKNIIQFTPRVSSNLGLNPENKSQMLTPEEFYSQLQQEDYWEENEDANDNPSAS